MSLKQTVHRVLFGVATGLGGIGGLALGVYSARYLNGLSQVTIYACYAAFTILGLVVGILSAHPVADRTAEAVESAATGLQKASLSEVVLAALGLIVGLGVAFFVSLAIQSFKLDTLPLVGVWLSPVLIILNAILFGALGAFVGLRFSAAKSVRGFLDTKDGPGGPLVLIDTSIIVDGRLPAVLSTGFLPGRLVVPQFVLGELQTLADAEDPLKRVRGRRGLELLEELRSAQPFEVLDDPVEGKGADQKLVKLSRLTGAALLTNDYNLQKVASVQGVKVLNLNQLASALKPTVLPGQVLQLSLQREGKENHQGVAYFEDGTMVVVERGRPHIGKDVIAEVTSVMQTATGKMVFAKFRHLVENSPVNEESA
ncbi:PIN domain nuclease [bacterium]|nr:PIN domain nuclease [bacterium]